MVVWYSNLYNLWKLDVVSDMCKLIDFCYCYVVAAVGTR